jgi:hypothetical protein
MRSMAKVAYCDTCKATYPLNVVSVSSRSGKTTELTCPLGHTEVHEIEEVPTPAQRES